MPYSPHRRACLLIPFNDNPHLFVVLNDPCKDGYCLLVMVSSIKNDRPYDGACLLNQGEHEFIAHPSYVVYRLANLARAIHISNMVDKKYYIEKPDIEEEIYERVITGLIASDETRPRIIEYAKNVGICT